MGLTAREHDKQINDDRSQRPPHIEQPGLFVSGKHPKRAAKSCRACAQLITARTAEIFPLNCRVDKTRHCFGRSSIIESKRVILRTTHTDTSAVILSFAAYTGDV